MVQHSSISTVSEGLPGCLAVDHLQSVTRREEIQFIATRLVDNVILLSQPPTNFSLLALLYCKGGWRGWSLEMRLCCVGYCMVCIDEEAGREGVCSLWPLMSVSIVMHGYRCWCSHTFYTLTLWRTQLKRRHNFFPIVSFCLCRSQLRSCKL